VPTGKGFWLKSEGFKPPAANSVPAGAVLLAGVVGVVGRFAAYWMAVVACAGTKLFWNWSTSGTLPSGFPVLGSTLTPIR